MNLFEQNCKNCKFSRKSSMPSKNGQAVLSCRFTPPTPVAGSGKSMFNSWRMVPENFWCGCWQVSMMKHE